MAEVQAQKQQTVEDLGKLVKAKYPNAYGALSDVDVGQKVKAKYPQYSQFADIPAAKSPSDSTGSVVGDVFAGLGAHVFSDIQGLGKLTGASKLLPAKANEYLEKLSTAPGTLSGQAGKGAGDIADYFIGAGEGKVAGKGLAAVAKRAATSGLKAGAVGAVQGGDIESGIGPAIIGGTISGLLGLRGSVAEVVNKIPKSNPVARTLLRRVPFIGKPLDTVVGFTGWLKSVYGEKAVEVLPKESRDELALRLYEEIHGAPPASATQRVAAIKELDAALKEAPKERPVPLRESGAQRTKSFTETPLEPEPPKPGISGAQKTKSFTETPLEPPPSLPKPARSNAQRTVSFTGSTSTPTGDPTVEAKNVPAAASGVTPMGKLKIRGDIFANVDQMAKKAGANPAEFKKAFRTIVENKYGKGISAMNEQELMEVANHVQDLLKH